MKYEISITEHVTFRHTAIVEIPDDNDMGKVLSKVEQESNCFSDVIVGFAMDGYKVIKTTEDASGDGKIEIDDYFETD